MMIRSRYNRSRDIGYHMRGSSPERSLSGDHILVLCI
jgi:hypothetical protein